MKHYLKALKQKNSLLFSVGIVMLLVLTLCLSGCSEKNEVQDQTNGADTIPNQSASAEEPSSILYVNHQLGFSMEMPLNWKNTAFTTKTGEIVSPFITSQPMITARAAFFSLLTATPANGARTTRRSLQGTALSSRKQKRIPTCSGHRVMSNIANQILCWQKPISLLLHSKTSLSPISMQPVRP